MHMRVLRHFAKNISNKIALTNFYKIQVSHYQLPII